MIFLTLDDFKATTRTEDLNRLTDNDSTVLDAAELSAITTIKTEMKARFDIDADILQTGTNRSQQLIDWVLDLTIYRIHYRINPRNVSESVQERFDLAVEQMRNVVRNKGNAVGLTPQTDEDGENIKYTSINTGNPPTRWE